MNVIKITVGPTVSLVAAYLMAIERDALAPPMPIEAMQIRPDSNCRTKIDYILTGLTSVLLKIQQAKYLQILRQD